MRKTIEILNRMVADEVIDGYAIAGAVAAIFYTEPTDTVDLDILVAFPKTDSLVTLELRRLLLIPMANRSRSRGRRSRA